MSSALKAVIIHKLLTLEFVKYSQAAYSEIHLRINSRMRVRIQAKPANLSYLPTAEYT